LLKPGGASKLAADVMAKEYGRYFGLNVGLPGRMPDRPTAQRRGAASEMNEVATVKNTANDDFSDAAAGLD
jgi:hypothetical protein